MKSKLEILYTNGKRYKITGVLNVEHNKDYVEYVYRAGKMLVSVQVPTFDVVAVRHTYFFVMKKMIVAVYKPKSFAKLGGFK